MRASRTVSVVVGPSSLCGDVPHHRHVVDNFIRWMKLSTSLSS